MQAHPAVRPPRHPYRPAWEADLLGLQRVSTYLSQGRWFRQVNSTGTLALGGEVCHVGRAWARQEVALTFDPTAQQLQVWGPQEHLLKGVPIQGLSPTQLMGEAGSLVHLRPFQ